ncbi:uncharacterized protein LOC116309488 [Oreochromis aureus]|uniref:uncharacterized protein LOC116309488 n=1 Tax=Oreochromis aureus TaxID=47969 RepID=UPI0019530FE1|nr:uncharacterized protein LOC116309488 [Oreochromis aureus]
MESLGVVMLLSVIPGKAGQDEVQVEAGADATLDCQGLTEGIITVLAWNKRGMQTEDYVFFYREDRPYKAYQHPSFQGRVELGDPQMKGGNMSIILHNTTVNDTGIYECHISYQSGSGRDKRVTPEIISETSLKVVPTGHTGGDTEDGGKEAGEKKDGVKEDGSVGLKAGLPVAVFLLLVVVGGAFVGCWIFRKDKPQTQDSHPPPAEPQIEMSKRFLNSESPAAEYNNRTELKANNCLEQSTRIPDVTLTLENELLHPLPQETAGLLPERNIRVQ